MKERIVRCCGFIKDFNLSNAVGGNISVRWGDSILTTPSGLATVYGWDISESDIWEYSLSGEIKAEGLGKVSRDFSIHLRILSDNPEIGAVIHSHSEYLVAFALRQKPVEPLTDMALRALGTIPVIEGAQGDRRIIGELVSKNLSVRSEELKDHGIGVLLPNNGIIIVGKTLDESIDALARAVENARAQIYSKMVP